MRSEWCRFDLALETNQIGLSTNNLALTNTPWLLFLISHASKLRQITSVRESYLSTLYRSVKPVCKDKDVPKVIIFLLYPPSALANNRSEAE